MMTGAEVVVNSNQMRPERLSAAAERRPAFRDRTTLECGRVPAAAGRVTAVAMAMAAAVMSVRYHRSRNHRPLKAE
jgi:hypothetical protein